MLFGKSTLAKCSKDFMHSHSYFYKMLTITVL